MSSETNLVKAIYSFKGKNNDELCFKKGDIITVTQRVEGGWWEGTLGETTGWFPSNYITEYKDSAGSITTSPIRAPADIQTFRNVVLKDIIDSEKAHVAEMQGLVTNFLEPLEKSDILTRDEFKQLTGNISEVLQTHEQFLSLVEDCAAKTGHDQRVGGLFLQWAPNMKVIHQRYCSGHPKAVCILDKYKEELNTWMESAGAVCPGVLVLTAGLSKPFRRLGKYPAMLQELARHVLESHPDRGDTQRAALVYRDIDNDCSALRRQKELELQVVTGEVRGWPGGELSALGDVLHMGSVAVGPSHQDRYLVLFQNSLLLLSVSKRVSAFVYEGNLPLTGISVCKLDDTDTRKNAFEISGPMIDPIIAVCQTKAEADNWVSLLQKHSNTSSPVHDVGQPSSLPHLARSPSEGALSSINSNRRSLYHVTLPPPSYPSASPYYSLTKYFAKLVKKKVITRQMLRKLLHEKPWAKAFEMSGLPIKRRHKNQIKLRVHDDGNIETETECSDTEESDCETDTTESYTNSSCTDDFCNARIPRQDALDHASPRTLSSATSSCGSNFGYVRYFNQSSDVPYDLNSSIKGDCTKNLFDSISSNSLNKDIEDEFAKEINSPLCRTKAYPALFIQNPLNSEDLNTKPYNMAYEDLVNIDDDLCIQNLGSLNDDFETTRRSFSNCNECTREVTVKPWKSAEEEYCGAKDCEHSKTNSLISSDLVYDLDPPKSPTLKNYANAEPILDPPPMFRNNLDKVKVMNMPNKNIPFRNHSINSDKRIRRSVTKSLLEYTKLDSDPPSLVDDRQRMSTHSDKNKSKKCECCNRSLCHSPRSSDSGVVGSCNLASPELNMHEYVGNTASGNYLESRKKSITSDDIKFSTVDILPESYNTEYSKQSRLSELEAAKFEDQCRCTSPFDSTPRTSCETSFTTENVFVGFDSSRASVTSTYSDNTPVSSAQPLRKMQRTSIRADINQHLLEKKVKPKPPPRLYRQPSTHLEVPKNVRQPIINPGWSTINISERTKPSLHYHMRIFREKPEVYESRRESRKDTLRNCDIFKDQSRDSENGNKNKKSRSRSEDLSKLNKLSKETQTGFMVYRSDLYAHWWMKAKLPITVVTDSGSHLITNPSIAMCMRTLGSSHPLHRHQPRLLATKAANKSQYEHRVYYYLPNMTTTDGSNGQGLTNHKRSHSFNNHQSFSQHSQQTQKNKQHNQSARWLLNSCDSLDQPPIRPNKASIGTKFCSVDFIDTAGTSYVNTKGWSVTSLRPAPPLRPQLHSSGSDDGLGQRLAYAPNQRKSNSYEEDALILKVIEAYCTSARCRNAVSSVDCGLLSRGKVQTHAHLTNSPPHNYPKILNRRSNDAEYVAWDSSKYSKVKRNKSSLAETSLYRVPESKKLLAQRKFHRSNPNVWESAEESRRECSGSHPSLTSPRSARTSTWCCGSFVKQIRKSHHFD